jgi:hypothetical protein
LLARVSKVHFSRKILDGLGIDAHSPTRVRSAIGAIARRAL